MLLKKPYNVIFALFFLIYEIWQGIAKKDKGYEDLKSTLIGMAIVGVYRIIRRILRWIL